jgi:hypothetical protein
MRAGKRAFTGVNRVLSFELIVRRTMDLSLVTAALGAQTGLTQLALAGSMLKMNTQNAASVVKLIDAAQQNMNSLANVAPGVGTNLDITA